MSIKRLGALVDTTHEVTADDWTLSYLLGAARTKTNSARSIYSDRGTTKNATVDLIGAFAEVRLLSLVDQSEDRTAYEYMRNHLFVPTGGKGLEGADAV